MTDSLLFKYWQKFGECFPLMQAPDDEQAVKHLNECLLKDVSAPKLYPDIYGAAEGKEI